MGRSLTPPVTQLRRDLGFVSLTALAAGMMFGTGIFFGPSLTAEQFPDEATVFLMWAIGGVIALAGAWTFGRLGALYPVSGGPYVYARTAIGPAAGFLFGWTSFILIAPTVMAALALAFAYHVDAFAPLTVTGQRAIALWAVAAVTFANVLGVKTGGRVQSFMTALKILTAGALVILLFTAGGDRPDVAPVEGGGRFSAAFVGILFAVGGWEYAILASEEVRNPRTTIPRAVFAGTAMVVVAYLAIVAACLAALGADGVARATALAPEAAEAVLAGSGVWVAAAVALSAFGTMNAIVLLGPRATFALARDGLLPPAAAHVSARWGTPVVAILFQTALATVYLLTGAFKTIATYAVVGTGIFITLSAFLMPRLRRLAGVPRTRWTWFEDATAFAVGGAYLWFLGNLVMEDPYTALVGFGLVLVGLIAYVGLARGRPMHQPNDAHVVAPGQA